MTGVHVYDIHSNPIVFHYSVGSDIAYLQLVGNARASVHGISKTVYTRASFFMCPDRHPRRKAAGIRLIYSGIEKETKKKQVSKENNC